MKRLLFLTYYFPPSGGPGVQRALKFARYLPAHGWRPTVLTVDPNRAAYPDRDPSLEREVPPELEVVRTPAWDPYEAYARLQGKSKAETVGVGFVGEAEATWKQRLARWVRANVFLPDARVGWVPFAIREGQRLLARGGFDAILSTGPPHSLHLAAWALARTSGLPWVADFRDPWTGIDYYDLLPMTPPARALDRALERLVLRRADAVSVVSPSMRRGLEARHPRAYAVIQNGFDPADFEAEAPPPAGGEAFDLTYVGNLNEARTPVALWRALAEVGAAVPKLRVRLVGHVDPVAVQAAEAAGVGERVETGAYVPHDAAVRLMRQSPLVLLVINRVPGAEGIMTGKLYEYVASGRPVLGIGPADGDAAQVLRATGAGEMFDWDDTPGVAAFLRRHYAAWASGAPLPGATPDAAEPYSRRGQAGQLARLLADVSGS